MAAAANMFSVRLVTADYYMASPLRGLDVCQAPRSQAPVRSVPVVRVFGATPAGERARAGAGGAPEPPSPPRTRAHAAAGPAAAPRRRRRAFVPARDGGASLGPRGRCVPARRQAPGARGCAARWGRRAGGGRGASAASRGGRAGGRARARGPSARSWEGLGGRRPSPLSPRAPLPRGEAALPGAGRGPGVQAGLRAAGSGDLGHRVGAALGLGGPLGTAARARGRAMSARWPPASGTGSRLRLVPQPPPRRPASRCSRSLGSAALRPSSDLLMRILFVKIPASLVRFGRLFLFKTERDGAVGLVSGDL